MALLKRLSLFLLVFAWSAPGAVLQDTASGASVSVSGHSLVFSREDAVDPSGPKQNLLLHQTSLRGEFRQYNLGVDFTNRVPLTKTSGEKRPFTLEKVRATAEWERWKITLGDAHVELGKGLALSLYRDPVFGIDNTVMGGSAKYTGGGFSTGVFGGRVHALQVPVAVNAVTNPLLDRQVYVAGAEAKGDLGGGLSLGGHYLFAANQPDGASIDRRWHTVGAAFSREALDEVDLYLESNVLLTQRIGSLGTESLPTGFGTYGAISWVPAPWKFRLEAKDYRDYRFEFRRPPTLEEDFVETVNTQDVSAGRLVVERRFDAPHTFARASYLLGRDRLKNSPVHHGVLGGGFDGPGRMTVELGAGYRSMPNVTDLTHLSAKTKLPTFEGQSVELGLRRLFTRTDLARVPVREDKNIVDLTYNFSSKFNLSAGMEIVPTNTADVGKHFFNAGAALKLGAFAAKAFLGKTSGGTLCSGGVCRQVPPFSGGSLDSTYTF